MLAYSSIGLTSPVYAASVRRVGGGGGGGTISANAPLPPQAEKVRLERAKDARSINSVENIPEIVDHL